MGLEIRNYPIVLLKDLENLLLELRKVARENSDVLEIIKNTDIFRAKELYADSKFTFRVYGPAMNGIEPIYTYSKTPNTTDSIKSRESSGNSKSILVAFRNWVNTVRQYHTINLEEEDYFEAKYEKEFYEDFKIIDEDAKTSTFNFSQQIALNNYIQNTIIYLEDPKTEIQENDRKELIEEAKQVEKSISTEPKEIVIKRNSKFWAKARKKSISVCKFIVTEFAKEVIKESTKMGFHFAKENLPYYIEQIRTLLTSSQ